MRILEETQPHDLGRTEAFKLPYTLESGPFAGLQVHSKSATVNAAAIHKDLIDTYLITHPHLDHISAFVINTAGLTGSRQKRLAGLPSTIHAFKKHIFNNIIWPNLSDENHGAGMITYMRLNEGGNHSMGEGDGYMEFSDNLAIKAWSVSHGHCVEKLTHQANGGIPRYGSMDVSSSPNLNTGILSPRSLAYHNTSPGMAGFLHSRHHTPERSPSIIPGPNAPSGVRAASLGLSNGVHTPTENVCVYDSSAYFIRDVTSGREVLIFGDVEPDSVSLSPRNLRIWQEAAPKFAAGKLAAIFIECSYDDSRPVDRLFGHLTPRFVIEEMGILAEEVEAARVNMRRAAREVRGSKRKRDLLDETTIAGRRRSRATNGSRQSDGSEPISPKTSRPSRGSVPHIEDMPDAESPHLSKPTSQLSLVDHGMPSSTLSVSELAPTSEPLAPTGLPLKGLKVVLIHTKNKMADGPEAEDTILAEFEDHEHEVQLGCEFIISEVGQSHIF